MSSGTGGLPSRWHSEDGDPASVVRCLDSIRQRQSERDERLRDALCQFDDFPMLGFAPAHYTVRRNESRIGLTCNVVRACCTAVQSEIIQARPRPMFLTTDGEWSLRRKAKRLGQYVEGLFESCQFDQIGAAAVTDATVFGCGLAIGCVERGKVQFERLHPWSYWVDERDGYYGKPRNHYVVRHADRDDLAARYKAKKAAIMAAPAAPDAWSWGDEVADQVMLVEAWHLPDINGEGGRHVVAIADTVLEDEEWEHDWVPILKLNWRDPLLGFWPQGLAMELDPIQTSINKKLKAIAVGEHYNTFPRIAFERGSAVTKSQLLHNEPATGFEYTGKAPEALVFPTVNPAIYAGVETEKARAYEVSGLNQLTARAERPAGVTSGRGMRIYSDLQSRRLIDFQRAYERFYMAAAKLAVRLMEVAANDNEALDVVYTPKRGRPTKIAWNDVRLDESTYVLSVMPTSALPSTPAGRLESVQGMIDSGFAQAVGLPPQELLRLLDFPDLDQAANRVSASVDLVEQILEKMMDGTYIPPEEFFDLNLCILLAARSYQQWTLDEVPEDILDQLAQWIDEARDLRDRLAAPPAPPPGAAPVGAPGVPLPNPAQGIAAPGVPMGLDQQAA